MDDGVIKSSPAVKRAVTPQPERIALTKESVAKVKAWLMQIGADLRGVRVSKNEFVNWVICNQADALTAQEMTKLEAEFFDELRFAEWALRELKAAKARGEKITLQTLMSESRPNLKPAKAVKIKPIISTREPGVSPALSSGLPESNVGSAKNRHEQITLKQQKLSCFTEKFVDLNESK